MNHWYVIRTNPNCETRAKEDLESMGFEVFFPTFTKEVKHARKKNWIRKSFPLFNRYMFISMPQFGGDWFHVRRANGVECVLGVNGEPFPVPGHLIERYIREFDNGTFDELRTKAPKIVVGEQIKIADGPLTGYYGMVTKAENKKKIRVMIDMFKSCSEIELPLAIVEKAG